jgi:RES domain-containing protein
MDCCANCFGDQGLTEIIEARSSARGRCPYCESEDVDLLDPRLLGNYFSQLLPVYEPAEDGKLLVEWFKEDWCLFQHERLDAVRASALLAEILDDGDIVRRSFVPSTRYTSDPPAQWEQLRSELMYKNRYHPESPFDKDRLTALLDFLETKEVGATWYRARIQPDQQPLTLDQMGPPPSRSVSHGRANPSGIPYLYLGSTVQTAISEIRPHTGELACVATYEVPAGLRVADLRNPRKLVSPFRLDDENQVGQMRIDVGFLEQLGDELTRPVLPQGAAIDYVPSQYLCEFIKTCKFDGVIYRSSVSDGINLALFNPDSGQRRELRRYRVTRVSVETAPEEE